MTWRSRRRCSSILGRNYKACNTLGGPLGSVRSASAAGSRVALCRQRSQRPPPV